MTWSFNVEPGGLVWLDPGPERPMLKDALGECVASLSPAGTSPSLSTYWVDRLLARLSADAPREAGIWNGNAWDIERRDERVIVSFQYAEQPETEMESISVDELTVGLMAYREAIIRAVESGHQLDDRWWAQVNP
jgi:hypothetical protein